MKHFSHEHDLVLKAEEPKTDGEIRSCDGCSVQISGPFYSCGECGYYLHKVCTELPNEINHPMHPQHHLTLLSKSPYSNSRTFICNICGGVGKRFVYNCSICSFDVDPICASTLQRIEDKCHDHPLTPLPLPISFPCHICRTEEKGLSYKCSICLFWVHQNCTVSLLPRIDNQTHHPHLLTLLQSVPPEYEFFCTKCDICHDSISRFHCVYYCMQCLYFVHVSCATSEEAPQSSEIRNQIHQDVGDDGSSLILLPIQPESTDLVSWFAEKYRYRDAITNMVLGFDESYIDQHTNIMKEIHFSYHTHPVVIIDDDQVSEDICPVCALPISTPSYGCIDCSYFLHKCCTNLPKHILHPFHPQHQISLHDEKEFFRCHFCNQWCNGFSYRCFEIEHHLFRIDIKCASFLRCVKHESHKHRLIPRLLSSLSTCTACGGENKGHVILQCTICSFSLCFGCAMAPSIMEHRYDKHPFILTYCPPENHYNEYICDLCEKELNPKYWFYHCRLCDQFAHVACMVYRGADSNINYGKTYKYAYHKHQLALVSCTRSRSDCDKCRLPMYTGYSIGLECKTCDFSIHVLCALNRPAWIPN